jgi:hypothetical protein
VTGPRAIAALALAALAIGVGGCVASSVTVPLDRDMVWQAAYGEAAKWPSPTIDDKTYTIRASQTNPINGGQIDYTLEVTPNHNPFATAPSTVISVMIQQTKPDYQRYEDQERIFLQGLINKLHEMVGR